MSLDTTPRAFATVRGGSASFTSPDGRVEPLAASPGADIRQVILQRAAAAARTAGIPVELVTDGDRGEHRIVVFADGTLSTDTAPEHVDAMPNPQSDPSQQGEEVNTEAPGIEGLASDLAPEPSNRRSFIAPTGDGAHAPTGWPSLLAKLGIGPSRAAVQRESDKHAVADQWAGCRTIAVVNGKGGVGKTMTTAILTAVFARHGGGNVLAWDNNDTRGTLGWRTEQGHYDTTVKDLLPAAEDLLTPGAGVSDIARFVHHQSVDRYDVLRSNPELLATDQRIAAEQFDLLMRVAARYYRLVIFDSGNDESADRWLRMIDSSHQLVVPTLAVPESAESAALLLDALRARDDRSRYLARNAVVIVTEAEPDRRLAARITSDFAEQVRGVVRIPFDPALKSGQLRLDALRPTTRTAWVHAAAMVARGL
ncbi:MAG: nucleotide-binding protein [Microbacterium sp.]|uniref:MinD/ParA family ATP-binding protein n=1 Tax=Microbacterium sp. TaxID=51671 RepID=UPI003F81A671